jgi:Uncharacterized protein conserved in cyanobacteria
MITRPRATADDLYSVPGDGKAEVVNGEIVRMSPTGRMPNRASSKIWLRLYQYEVERGTGIAVSDNAGFRVALPNRESFSPDAAFFIGDDPGMRFFEGAPVFAAEVRSEGDYGPAAEQEMQAKRADYFAAGTRVVWDVDLQGIDVVRKFTPAGGPEHPAAVFRRGETADAEPAVPDWRMAVDDLFG